MQFSASFTELALLALLAILSLSLSCWLARYPRKTSVGVMLGVVLGVFLTNLAAGIVLSGKCPPLRADRFLAGKFPDRNSSIDDL
ncbi:hypothetical protein EIQ31_07735 [Agrobacterium deltaense]|nr:hypothetical protein EIQ31_07735 [Agrobacterium deltaense]